MADLEKGEMKITTNHSGDFTRVADGEPLKVHVQGVEKTTGKNFDTGEEEPRLLVKYELDEEEGRGQVYLDFLNPVLHPKSKLGKVCQAIYGETPTSLDPTDMIGQPLRITLKTKLNKAGEERQWPDTYLKPAKDQKPVTVTRDAKPTDTEVESATIDVESIPF